MNEVKLIIWDLDDTLWQGTLADGDDVKLNPLVIEKIQFLLDKGIVHSICSKNDALKAEKVLKALGIYDLFIFPSISFNDKGLAIKKIIKQAQLREQNVLFVDDNPFVMREVAFHNPSIMTQLIDDFLLEDITHWGKNDSNRERLTQYKILEKKEKNRSVFLEENDDEQAFLKQCSIDIQLIPLNIDDKDVDRVIELVNRSNQMNFTQSRIKYDYLFTLFELKNGINYKIQVKDKFGDYGVVGYVCILKNTLQHFVFSCRILGMCVESRTYQWLFETYPNIKSTFNLAKLKNIDTSLDFITIAVKQKTNDEKIPAGRKILVRGPCIANAISFLLNESFHIDEEIFPFFEYANLNFLRENFEKGKNARFEKTNQAIAHNQYHTIVNFLESDYYSGNYLIQKQLTPIASHYIFWKNLRFIKKDNKRLASHIDTMILESMRNISKFNIGDNFSPWPKIEKIGSMVLNLFGEKCRKIVYQLAMQVWCKNYQGYVSESQFEQNLLWYIELFPSTTQLVFLNPPENILLPLMSSAENKIILQRTQQLNQIVRKIAKERSNIFVLEMSELLEQNDIIDSFSHLKRQGYIKLSRSLLNIVEKWMGAKVNSVNTLQKMDCVVD